MADHDAAEALTLLHRTADAVAAALADHGDWGPSGRRAGQYASDVVADAAALGVLDAAGVGVLSEESGLARADEPILVVVDPLDGSTNASRGIPWFATALCAVDEEGPLAAVVAHLVGGTRWEAVRGGGAHRDGDPVAPTRCASLRQALVGLSGYPPEYLGWRQYRALGAAALDLCAVADGTLDGYLDCSWNAHGTWDHLAGALICAEAGALAVDAFGRDLVAIDHEARRTPVAAATPELLAALVEARGRFHTPAG